MNALTKAFVVVVTILAVILVALVVPFAARVPDYAQQYKDKTLELQAQREQHSKDVTEARALVAAEGTKNEDLQKQINDLNSQLALVTSDFKAEQAKVAEATAVTSRATSALQVATSVNASKDELLAKNASLINEQIGTMGELNGRIADLTQTIIAVRAENSRLANNYRRIQEENIALVTQLREAAAKYDEVYKNWLALGGDPKKLDGTPHAPEEINGSVVKIDQVGDGLTFVQLNVGTRDQVKEGMEFTVYRGDSFVGKIKIASVDTAESVGRLTLGEGVKEGDKVRTGGR